MSVVIQCDKHGEVEVDPDDKGNVVCPQCILDAARDFGSGKHGGVFSRDDVLAALPKPRPVRPSEPTAEVAVLPVVKVRIRMQIEIEPDMDMPIPVLLAETHIMPYMMGDSELQLHACLDHWRNAFRHGGDVERIIGGSFKLALSAAGRALEEKIAESSE